jgi:hypothetical protein
MSISGLRALSRYHGCCVGKLSRRVCGSEGFTKADEDGLGRAGEEGGQEEGDANHGLAEEPEGQEDDPEICRRPEDAVMWQSRVICGSHVLSDAP